MADLQHRLISRIIGVFSSFFFAQNHSNVNTESILTCFREFKFLTQIEYFAKAIAFARWPIFNIVLFLEYLVFSRAVFAQNYFSVNTESILTVFRECKSLASIEHFAKAIAHAKAIAFARWPIFNIVSFLE